MTFLSRLTLSRKPSVEALKFLLDPHDQARRLDTNHRLIWSAFASDPDAKRDFLWRDEGGGRFLVLSPHPPEPTELFDPPEVKDFAPHLRAGDRLAFLLRANATHTIKRTDKEGKETRKHRDVTMHALKKIEQGKRAPVRMEIAQQAGETWLKRAGSRAGFSLSQAVVRGYHVHTVPGPRSNSPRFGILDFEGTLTVDDPDRFISQLKTGFGRAKAFGCGLMLIKRA